MPRRFHVLSSLPCLSGNFGSNSYDFLWSEIDFTRLENRSCVVPESRLSICVVAFPGCEALEGELPGLALGRLILCIAVLVDTGLVLWTEPRILSGPLVCLARVVDSEAAVSDAPVCKLVVFLRFWDIGRIATFWALIFAKEFAKLLVRPCMGPNCMFVSNFYSIATRRGVTYRAIMSNIFALRKLRTLVVLLRHKARISLGCLRLFIGPFIDRALVSNWSFVWPVGLGWQCRLVASMIGLAWDNRMGKQMLFLVLAAEGWNAHHCVLPWM